MLALVLAAVGRDYLAPWGAGYPLAGQLYGCPSTPRRVYSCSMPNQMQCSFTCSITLVQLALWLVSENKPAVTLLVPSRRSNFHQEDGDGGETFLPAGNRLYLRTSQSTSLFGSRVNGSLNMLTGTRYMSLLEPSAW